MEGWVQLFRGNIAFFNKVFQTYLLPRVLLAALCTAWLVWVALLFPGLFIFSLIIYAALIIALLMGIPAKWYNKQLLMAFLQIPGALVSILKAMLHIGKARKQFIHTPHGEDEANKTH